MKTFCILFMILAWTLFLIWMQSHIVNKGMKLGIPVLTLAVLFFCCMGVRATPAKLLFIPAIIFTTAFGVCLFFAITNIKRDMYLKRYIFIAACAVSATVLMYTDARISSRNSYPRNPLPLFKPETEPKLDGNVLDDYPVEKFDKSSKSVSDIINSDPATTKEDIPASEELAANDIEAKEVECEGAETETKKLDTEQAVEENIEKSGAENNAPFYLDLIPYAISEQEKNRFVTFGGEPLLLLRTAAGEELAKDGIFNCRVADRNGNTIESAVIAIKPMSIAEDELCFVSHIGRGDGSSMVIVHPIKAGMACLEISSPQSDMARFVLVKITDSEEES